ncbi:ABC transporter substrate-binding protein [Pseudochelatococcus sp. B33]
MTAFNRPTSRRGFGKLTFSLALAAAFGSGAGKARAQNVLQELASYSGPDRAERLLEGARAEGALSIYTSQRQEDMTAVAKAFEEKYGIRASVWRANSDVVLQRALTENRAGRFSVDVFETNGNELEALHREEVLQKVVSPSQADIMPLATRPHGEWIGTRLNIITSAINTELVSAEDAPTTWTDFLNPKWKGKIGVEADDADWFAEVVNSFPSEEEGLDFFRELVATNGLSVRKGHSLMLELVAAGEIPLAMTVYQYHVDGMKKNGGKVDWLLIKPAIARVNGLAVANAAPHPNAALLFYDFLLTDGQKLYAEREYTPTNISVSPLPENLELTMVDPVRMLDEGKKWQQLFEDIVINRGR